MDFKWIAAHTLARSEPLLPDDAVRPGLAHRSGQLSTREQIAWLDDVKKML